MTCKQKRSCELVVRMNEWVQQVKEVYVFMYSLDTCVRLDVHGLAIDVNYFFLAFWDVTRHCYYWIKLPLHLKPVAIVQIIPTNNDAIVI